MTGEAVHRPCGRQCLRHGGIALGREIHANRAQHIGEHDQSVGFAPDETQRAQGRERSDIGQPVEDQIPVSQRALQSDVADAAAAGDDRLDGHGADTDTSMLCTAVLSPMSLFCPGFSTLTLAPAAFVLSQRPLWVRATPRGTSSDITTFNPSWPQSLRTSAKSPSVRCRSAASAGCKAMVAWPIRFSIWRTFPKLVF